MLYFRQLSPVRVIFNYPAFPAAVNVQLLHGRTCTCWQFLLFLYFPGQEFPGFMVYSVIFPVTEDIMESSLCQDADEVLLSWNLTKREAV